MAKYVWPENSQIEIDPQATGEELARLQNRGGVLTPDVVIEEARRVESPLHAHFEWDDRAAAEKYRREQAKELLESISELKN